MLSSYGAYCSAIDVQACGSSIKSLSSWSSPMMIPFDASDKDRSATASDNRGFDVACKLKIFFNCHLFIMQLLETEDGLI